MFPYKFLLPAALALGMIAACSDDDDFTGDATLPGGVDGATTEMGYVAISINLPIDVGTRADSNGEPVDSLADGLPQEYAVCSAYLLLFEGADSAKARFAGAYNITPGWEMDANKQITASAKIIQKVKSPYNTQNTKGDKLYALALLNAPGDLKFDKYQTDSGFLAMIIQKDTFQGTFADLQKIHIGKYDTTANSKQYLTMSNAPLAITRQGDGKGFPLITLARIDSAKVFTSEAEARANPAAEIYVERVAAKVTVTNVTNETSTSFKPNSSNDTTWTYEIVHWAISNFNDSSYFSRIVDTTLLNIENNNKKRFMGSVKVGQGVDKQDLFRTYWAEDINYGGGITKSNALPTNNVNKLDTTGFGTAFAASQIGEDHPQYCHENTFNTKYQDWQNTTRVIIGAKLKKSYMKDAATFWTLNGVTDSIYTRRTQVINTMVAGKVLLYDAFQEWWKNTGRTTTLTCDSIKIVNYHYTDRCRLVVDSCQFHESVTASSSSSGKAKSRATAEETTSTALELRKTLEDSICAYLNTVAQVDSFAEGIAYYAVRIKHFGDDLTPWSDYEHRNQAATTDNYYGPKVHTDAALDSTKYLGRYGVVRNNWYNIDVTGIKALGTPYVPTLTETNGSTPDDEVDAYIAVKINILSWAKRQQSVVLK